LLCVVESGGRLIVCLLIFAMLAVFGILAKGTLLFIAGLSVVAIGFDLMARGNFKLATGLAVGTVAALAGGWMAAGQGLFNFPSFCAHLLSIVQGYDKVMGLDGLQTLRSRGMLAAAMAAATVVVRSMSAFDAQTRHLVLRRGVLLGWLAALVLMIWKHGFVR